MTKNNLAQRRWVKKQRDAGRCQCGHERALGKKSCERCLNKVKDWYVQHREYALLQKQLPVNRQRREELRRVRTQQYKDICYAAYGGYVCACCGEIEPMFLDLDHVNNDGAAHRKEIRWDGCEGLYRWIIKHDFPPLFQVLCRNCNWGKYRNGGRCPHQDTQEKI